MLNKIYFFEKQDTCWSWSNSRI